MGEKDIKRSFSEVYDDCLDLFAYFFWTIMPPLFLLGVLVWVIYLFFGENCV